MPRRFDERADYDDQPHRRQTSGLVIVVIVLGSLMLFGVVACVGLLLFGWTSAPKPMGGPAAVVVQNDPDEIIAGTRRIYSQKEFRDLVLGKTPDEVVAAVGKPDITDQEADTVRWTYRGRVKGPRADDPVAAAVVVFRDGKAAEVEY
ncbi:MAG TPA: hypothetical protein VKD90_01925 [Gemmataceae bacterium]|nr:hypothetical protein [Gemmataceae bacterium]